MARDFDHSSNQYLTSSAAPAVASGSFFVSMWVWCRSGVDWDQHLFYVHNSGVNNYWASIGFSTYGGARAFSAAMYDGSNNPGVSTSNPFGSIETWYHLLLIRDTGADKIKFYIDGSLIGETTDTTTGTPTLGNVRLGNRINSTSEPFGGYMAEAAMWIGSVPTASTIAGLAAGYSPAMFQPDTLAHYWPLLDNDSDQDRVGQLNLTATNSPTYATHPPIIYRSRPRLVAAASTSTPSIVGTIFRSPIIRAAS